MKKPVYALFIDLTAAFDHIKREWMFNTIYQRFTQQADKKLFQVIESLYAYTTTELAQSPNDVFEIFLVVRQGGPESPVLFNLYMDYVIRIFLEECKSEKVNFVELKYCIPPSATSNKRMKIGTHTIDWVGYADDILLVFESNEDLQHALNIMSTVFDRYHLQLNVTKTKKMLLTQQYLNTVYPESIATVNHGTIENVTTFKYLGCQIKYNEPSTGNTELELRIDTAENKFYELGKKLMNWRIMLRTRTVVFNALVRSRLTYSCQIWSLTKKQIEHINARYTNMIRKMVRGGFRRKEGSYSYVITNEDLLQKCNTESMVKYIRRQQRNFLAHIVRKSDTSITKLLLFNNNKSIKQGRKVTLYDSVLKYENITADTFNEKAYNRLY